MMRTTTRWMCAVLLLAGTLQSAAQPFNLDLSLDPGSGFNDYVERMIVQPDGNILVAGRFTTYKGVLCKYVTRLLPDGTVDPTFSTGTGPSDQVYDMALQTDGKILIAGNFFTVNGSNRRFIARLNSSGSVDLSFAPDPGIFGTISTMAIGASGKIYVGGGTDIIATLGDEGLVRLTSTGAIDPTFVLDDNFSGASLCEAVVEQPDGKVVVGGIFSSYEGSPCGNIVRINADGSHDASFVQGTGFGNSVSAISLLPSGQLVVGGYFTDYDGNGCNRIARLNSDGSFDATFAVGTGFDNPVLEIRQQPDGKLLMGGGFQTFNGATRWYLIRLLANGQLDTGFDPGTFIYGGVLTIEVQADGKVLAGGSFTTLWTPSRNKIARFHSCNPTTYYADADGDTYGDPNTSTFECNPPSGYVLNNADCDDTDDQVLGPLQWYLDADGDGWGAGFTMVLSCTQPPGYVDNDIDCDDSDPLNVPTDWYVDVDSDGHGDPTHPVYACEPPLGYTDLAHADDCNDDHYLIYPGAPCDDGDALTTNDEIQPVTCVCEGSPCEDVTFELLTDANGAQTSWELLDNTDQSQECSGSGYSNNSNCLSDGCCLPAGNHVLKVHDSGTGMSGSYILRKTGSGRIVDNSDGFSGSLAQHGIDGVFDMQMGTDHLKEASCDANGLDTTSYVMAASNPLVAAQVVPGNWSVQSPISGYQFWFFDPDGGYSKMVYQSLRSLNGQSGPDAQARYLKLNHTVFPTNEPPLPLNKALNVRVRGRVNGNYLFWGPACRVKINSATDAYWATHLVDDPGDPLHACGTTVSFDATDPLYALNAIRRIGSTAYHVRFHFERVSDGSSFNIDRQSGSSTNNRTMYMTRALYPGSMPNWPTAQPDPYAGEQFIVRIATKKAGTPASAWNTAVFGPCCLITIGNVYQSLMWSTDEGQGDVALQLWPNPNQTGLVNLALSGVEEIDAPVQVELVDATGRIALTRSLAFGNGGNSDMLALPASMAPGLYTVRATLHGHTYTKRLVVE